MKIIIHGLSNKDTIVPVYALQAAMKLLGEKPGTMWGVRYGERMFSVRRNKQSVSVWPVPLQKENPPPNRR